MILRHNCRLTDCLLWLEDKWLRKTMVIVLIIFLGMIFAFAHIANVSCEFEVPTGNGVSFIGLGLPLKKINFRVENIKKPKLRLKVVAQDDKKGTQIQKWTEKFRSPVNHDVINIFFSSSETDERPDGYGSCRNVNGWYQDIQGICVLSAELLLPRRLIVTVLLNGEVVVTKEELRKINSAQ